MAPSPAPHDRPSYIDIAPSASSNSPPAQRVSASATPNISAQRTGSGSPKSVSASKGSPNLYVHIYMRIVYSVGQRLTSQSLQVSKWGPAKDHREKGTFLARLANLSAQTSKA